MTPTWITVFHGPFTKALALQAVLEARGIPTLVPDAVTKVMDPFITGANPLAVELRVPEEARAEAEELLGAPADAGRAHEVAPRAAPDPVRLARLVRWCFVIPIAGWAIGTVLGLRYLLAARRDPAPPTGHGITLALWLVQPALLALAVSARSIIV